MMATCKILTKIKPTKPNINLIFRCDEEKYLNSMLSKGEIHFGSVGNWIGGKTLNNDKLEGAFRFVPHKNINNHELFKENNKLFVRDSRVKTGFGFCVFGVGDGDYEKSEEIDDNGSHYRCCYLETAYLEPYKSIPRINEYLNCRDNNKRKLIYITHPELFITAIMEELYKFGFKKDEIFCQPIVYIDKYHSNVYDAFPACLFYKDLYYSKENEIRIIIASERKEIIKNFLTKECNIEIGDISNYAKIIDFPYEDIQIRKVNNHIIFDTPNKFFLSNRFKSTTELCTKIIRYVKRGTWIHRRQKQEFSVICKILKERDGIFVNMEYDKNHILETQFFNANQNRKDDEFKSFISNVWETTN